MVVQVLQPEELQSLLRQFKKEHSKTYDLDALGYFGSYARGDAGAESDVDIVFETGAPNLFSTATMKQDLEALLGRPVHVFRLKGVRNPRLKGRIEDEAVYV